MEIEFDPTKDAQNRRKHGLPLRFALAVLAGVVREELDEDETGEERWIAYGRVGLHLFICVYTMRGHGTASSPCARPRGPRRKNG